MRLWLDALVHLYFWKTKIERNVIKTYFKHVFFRRVLNVFLVSILTPTLHLNMAIHAQLYVSKQLFLCCCCRKRQCSEKRVECDICCEKFSRVVWLNLHVKQRHPDPEGAMGNGTLDSRMRMEDVSFHDLLLRHPPSPSPQNVMSLSDSSSQLCEQQGWEKGK